MYPTLYLCKTPIYALVSNHTSNFIAIRPPFSRHERGTHLSTVDLCNTHSTWEVIHEVDVWHDCGHDCQIFLKMIHSILFYRKEPMDILAPKHHSNHQVWSVSFLSTVGMNFTRHKPISSRTAVVTYHATYAFYMTWTFSLSLVFTNFCPVTSLSFRPQRARPHFRRPWSYHLVHWFNCDISV